MTVAAPSALAVSFHGSRAGSRVSGNVSISDQRVDLSGTVWDTDSDGRCARLNGNWDVAYGPDHSFDVATACGNGRSAYGYGIDRIDHHARDFEVRSKTGSSYRVVWQGDNGDA